MDNKTRLAQMQEVRSHPKTERKSKEQIMNMITVDQETLMRMIAQAVEAEREACAQVVEALEGCAQYFPHVPDIIRARVNT
jgi:hypothetical protein